MTQDEENAEDNEDNDQERPSLTTQDEENDEDNEDNDDEYDSGRMHLRANRERTYEHLKYPGEESHGFSFTMLGTEIETDEDRSFDKRHLQQLHSKIVTTCKEMYETSEDRNVATKDMISGKAIKVFGQGAIDTIYKEFIQINDQRCFGAISNSSTD